MPLGTGDNYGAQRVPAQARQRRQNVLGESPHLNDIQISSTNQVCP